MAALMMATPALIPSSLPTTYLLTPVAPEVPSTTLTSPEGDYVWGAHVATPVLTLPPLPPPSGPGVSTLPPLPPPPARISTASVRAADEADAAGGSGRSAEHGRGSGRGMVLECVLAAQGIDAPASQMTGGAGGLPPLAAWAPSHVAAASSSGAAGAAAANAMQQGGKATKPKNNIKQTSSSFVQRISTHGELNRILANRTEGECFGFLNSGKSFFWMADLQGKVKEPLARVTFAVPVSAHDANQLTRSSERLDVVLGFATGDLMWLEVISSRYTRINKAGCMHASAVTQVRWLPGSENLFLSAHEDGTMLLCDRDREDAPQGSWEPKSMWLADPLAAAVRPPAAHDDGAQQGALGVGLQAWDSRRSMLVTRPGAEALANGAAEGKEGKKKEQVWAGRNPVAHWRVSETRINDFAFSPDFPHVAVAADDGMMRLIDVQDERLEASFGSYFGAFTCLAWSPDGRFLLTGSCDDLVTIWAPREGRIVARCPGHASFVRGLAFDPWRWRADDRIYRFASVGEDNRIILWDFSSAALHRPKGHAHAHTQGAAAGAAALGSSHKRPSIGSTLSLAHDGSGGARRTSLSARRASMGLELNSASSAPRGGFVGDALSHEAAGRGLVPELQPIASYTIPPPSDGAKDDLLAAVRFNKDGMLLLHRTGAVRHLERPAQTMREEPQPRSSMAARRHVRM